MYVKRATVKRGENSYVYLRLVEDNVARYLASELGAFVVLPDLDVAPEVLHPVSEE
jgi:hypothetical protein